MADTTINSLSIKITSDSKDAVDGLSRLQQTLKDIKEATKGGFGLTAVANQVEKLAESANKVNSTTVNNLKGLAEGMKKLSEIGNFKISSSIANQITNINTALSGLNLGNGADKIRDLVGALQPLETLGRSSLGTTVRALNQLPTALANIDTRQLHGQISALTRIMRPLADEMQKIANGFNAFPNRIQRLIQDNQRLTQSNGRLNTSYINLWARLRMAYNGLRMVASTIGKLIYKSAQYNEVVNRFNVVMGEYTKEHYDFAQMLGEKVGIDPAQFMDAESTIMSIATGFGIANDRAAKMSQQLTQLGFDIAAFVDNVSIEDAMLKIQSGFAGELEPLRRIGYDLSVARLQQEAYTLGITKKVSAMTQAEKAELRYYAIMTQVTSSHGEWAKTLNEPANQLRVFKTQVAMAGRAIGNIFIPLLNIALPYIIAFTKAIRMCADTIARLFGYELPEVKDWGGLSSGADSYADALGGAADNAKKLQKYTMGFDELNVIDPNQGSGSGGSGGVGGSGFDFELPEYDFLEKLAENNTDSLVEKIKSRLGEVATVVGIIGAGFLAWKITKGIFSSIERIQEMLKNPVLTKPLKITAGSILIAVGGTIEFTGIQSALTKGLDGLNFAEIIGGGGTLVAGAAILGSAFGKTMLGASIGAIVAGVPMAITGIIDAIKKGVNPLNTALTVIGMGLSGFAIGGFIKGFAAWKGGVMGAILGVAIAGGVLVVQEVDNTVAKVTGILGAASLAVGGILALTGANLPLGIGLMVVGAVTMGSSIALNTDLLSNEVKDVIAVITTVVSTALLAVGAVLAFSGANIPLGIGLMLGGAVTLGGAIAPSWDSMSNEVKGVVNDILGFVGSALLVVGAILAFTGVGIPLGIGLMLAGAGSLGTAAALNWDTIKDKVKTIVSSIVAILGGSLMVAGILLCLSGAGVGLGLALLFAGFKTSETAWKLDDNPVTRFVKKMANSIIGIVNKIIDAINKMFHIQFDGLEIGGVEVIPAFNVRLLNIPKIPTFEQGGYPEVGQMFIAREAGAELVGNIGRKTAVVNNEQIVASVSRGVAEANSEQNALLREQNSLLRSMLEKQGNVYLDGKKVTANVEKHQRERGRTILVGGVV